MPFPRSGTFRSGTFHSGSFRPGSFRPDAFPPRHFLSRHFLSRHFLSRRFLSRRFPPRHLSAPAFCFAAALLSRVFAAPPRGGCSSEREGARQGGRSLGRYGKGRRSVGRREGPVGRGEARSSEKGRPFGRKEPRQVRGGSVGGADTRLPEVPCGVHFRRKGCLRGRSGGPIIQIG